MHIRGLTMDGWTGISPITYAREAIGLALATEKFGSQLFRNGAKMGGILEHPGTVSYTHLRAHETVLDLVCRLLLEKKKNHTH